MVRRNVTALGKNVHVVERGLCGFEVSRVSLRASEASECVRRFADQLDAAFRGFDRFGVTTQTAEHETRAVCHHQVAWFVLECRARKTIRFGKTTRVIRTPDDGEARDYGERIEIATRVRFAQRLAEATFHRE